MIVNAWAQNLSASRQVLCGACDSLHYVQVGGQERQGKRGKWEEGKCGKGLLVEGEGGKGERSGDGDTDGEGTY